MLVAELIVFCGSSGLPISGASQASTSSAATWLCAERGMELNTRRAWPALQWDRGAEGAMVISLCLVQPGFPWDSTGVPIHG